MNKQQIQTTNQPQTDTGAAALCQTGLWAWNWQGVLSGLVGAAHQISCRLAALGLCSQASGGGRWGLGRPLSSQSMRDGCTCFNYRPCGLVTETVALHSKLN